MNEQQQNLSREAETIKKNAPNGDFKLKNTIFRNRKIDCGLTHKKSEICNLQQHG